MPKKMFKLKQISRELSTTEEFPKIEDDSEEYYLRLFNREMRRMREWQRQLKRHPR